MSNTTLYINSNDLQERINDLSCCIGNLGYDITLQLLGGKNCIKNQKLLKQLLTFKKLFNNYIPVGSDIITIPALSSIITYIPNWINWTGTSVNVALAMSGVSHENFNLGGQSGVDSYFNNLVQLINTSSTVGYKATWNGIIFTLISPASLGATRNGALIAFSSTGSGNPTMINAVSNPSIGGRTQVSSVSTEEDNIITEEEAQIIWNWISKQCKDCYTTINQTLNTYNNCIIDPQNNETILQDPSEDICVTAL